MPKPITKVKPQAIDPNTSVREVKPDPTVDLDLEADSEENNNNLINESPDIIDPEDKTGVYYDPGKTPEYPSAASKFSYNNRDELEYTKFNFPVPDKLRRSQERQFLHEVDITKGEIERQITRMYRIIAIDTDDPKKKRKEFIAYYENWYGKNWQGVPIAPVTDHVEGIYKKVERTPIVEKNRLVGWKPRQGALTYYIPYDPKFIEQKIADSIGSDSGTINFFIKDNLYSMAPKGGTFTYEDFTTKTFEELKELAKKN